LFSDFIEYSIHCFSEPNEHLDKKFEQYGNVLHDLFRDMILIYQDGIEREGWYDGLGEFYEAIASKYQKSDFGQFFTPRSIVDFMVSINGIKDASFGQTVIDPACGSGRFLIAVQSEKQGLLLFGQDLDRTCCLMTVFNMLVHGCVGEVVWGDTLAHEYRQGWLVNFDLNVTGFPSVLNLEKENSKIHASRYFGATPTKKAETAPEAQILELGKFKSQKGETKQEKLF
jgi:type I restriction enzyme M protein